MNKTIALPIGLATFAKKHELPLWQLEVLTVRPQIVCESSTIEEAKKTFHQAPSNSEKRMAAWMAWDALSLAVARTTNTVETLADVFNRSPVGGKAEKLALKKILSLITVESEAKKVLETINDSRKKTVARVLILKKWEKISLRRLSQAKTLDAVIGIFQEKPNTNRIESVFKNKLNHLFLKKISKVNSFMEMQNLFESALTYSDEWIFIALLNNWLRFAKTFDQKVEIFNAADNYSIPYEFILLDCIKSAQNFDQLRQLYYKISDYQGTQEIMCLKLAKLANTIKDLAYVYKISGNYCSVQTAVVAKMVKLYKKQPAKKRRLVKKST